VNNLLDMQRFFVDGRIQGIEREAAALRAERARNVRTHPALAVARITPDDVEGHALDFAVIAGTPIPVAASPSIGARDTTAGASGNGPCGDDPNSFSHAA